MSMEDFEQVLLRLAHHCKTLRGSECRLLVHLTAQAVERRCTVVEASERDIKEATGMGNNSFPKAKRRLHELGLVQQIPGGRGRMDRYSLGYIGGFTMPLFPPQPYGSTSGNHAPVSGAPAPVSGAPPAPVSGAPAPVSGAPGAPVSGAPAPVSGAPRGMDYAQGVCPARVESIESEVVSYGSFSSIDRVLTTKIWKPEQDQEVPNLYRYMLSWAAKDGDEALQHKRIDEQILAQCLAIGPLPLLEDAWVRIRGRLNGYKVESWGFFVTALLSEVLNVTPAVIKERRAALRSRKPAASEVSGYEYRNDILAAAVRGVRKLT